MDRLTRLVELQKLDDEIHALLNGAFESDDFDSLDKINKIKKSRTSISKKIDAPTIKRYERLRGRKKDTLAVAPVVEGVCTGCNITISTSIVARLHHASEFVSCDHCGRYIYIPKSVVAIK